jgi:tetratricopeptide (TPR) repeat protein
MKAEFFKWRAAALGFAFAISAAGVVSGAQYGGQSSAPPPQSAPPAQNEPKEKGEKKEKVNKAEEAAYKNVLAAQGGDPAQQIQVGEDFISKFPMSRYNDGIYGLLTNAYFATNNTDKMFAAGAKALELNPDNAQVLALLAMAIPRRVKANTPDGPQQLQKAEGYARHAIDLIPAMQKPEKIDDATFEKSKNDMLAMCHSGLGLQDINHQKYDDARNELTQAVALATSPDAADYYLLGNADSQASFLHGAVTAYEKCASAGNGQLSQVCKNREDSVKKDIDSGSKLSRD